MNTFEFFDKIYCIHIPGQTERKNLMNQEFSRLGLLDKVSYVGVKQPPATFTMNNMRRSPYREFGCNLSHFKAVITSAINGDKHPLFLEDDVIFVEGAEERLSKALTELPDNWGLLYFDGHPRRSKAKRYKTTLVKLEKFCFADSYCINQNQLKPYIDFWFERITQRDAMYDFILGDYSAKINSFCVYPTIVKQRSGYSIIGDKYEGKDHLMVSWDKLLE